MMAVHVALARFLEKAGLLAALGRYPYWYLGSTPFRYLTGPVLPGLLVGLHRVFPGFSLFEVFFGLVGAWWVLGGVGVYLLVGEIGRIGRGKDKTNRSYRTYMAAVAAMLYLFGPLAPAMFSFSNGLSIMSFSVVPWVLWAHVKSLRDWRQINNILFCIMTTFLLLLDISVLPRLILGMAAVLLAVSGWKGIEKKVKKTLKLVTCSLLLVSWWYTPGYWWQVLLAPSFAGRPLISVIGQISQIMPIGLAIVLAFLSAKTIKLKQPAIKFVFYWLFIFGFLTFFRFISDWDFVLDWSAYYLEIQFGLGILGALVVDRYLKSLQVKSQKLPARNRYACPHRYAKHCRRAQSVAGGKIKSYSLKFKVFLFLVCVFGFLFSAFSFTFKKYVLSNLQKDIKTSAEHRIGEKLAETAGPDDIVFLSGSTAFWTNAFFDIRQVRGGNDKAAVHPEWDKAAWEIREGEDVDKSLKRLKEFKIKYLVVHTKDSSEYYHDFKHPERFEGVKDLEKVYDERGDRIYKISNF